MKFNIDDVLCNIPGIEKIAVKNSPSSIANNTKNLEIMEQFELMNNIFVNPLLERFQRLPENKQRKVSINISLLSVSDRVITLINALVKCGIKEKNVLELIPTSIEDIKILMDAGKCDFNLSLAGVFDLSNKERVECAKDHLKRIEYTKRLNSGDYDV